MLTTQLSNKEFEFQLPFLSYVFYEVERKLAHLLFRRFPPTVPGAQLLNLGCGPLTYPGWINADDYAFKRSVQQTEFRPNWRLDITRPWKCQNDVFDGIFTQHVIEHINYSQAVFVFRECLRTLKTGAWLRVSVPSVSRYVEFYTSPVHLDGFPPYECRVLAMSYLAQMHMHKSMWDGELMTRVLTEVGFTDAREVSFGEGTDQRLAMDQVNKRYESLYVEARKSGPSV